MESPAIIARGLTMIKLAGKECPTRDVLMKKKAISCHDFNKCIHWSNTVRADAFTQWIRVDVLTRTSMIKCAGSSDSLSQSAVQNEYWGGGEIKWLLAFKPAPAICFFFLLSSQDELGGLQFDLLSYFFYNSSCSKKLRTDNSSYWCWYEIDMRGTYLIFFC